MLQGPVRSQVRLDRIPGSEEGVGGFGAEPGQVPQSSGKKKSERSGGFGAKLSSNPEFRRRFRRRFREALVQSQVKFNKVWEALVQSQVRFTRVPEKVWEALARARPGSTGFLRRLRRRCGRLGATGSGVEPGQAQQGSGEGFGEGLGGFGAEPGVVRQDLRPCIYRTETQPWLGSTLQKIVQIERCGCWGYHQAYFLRKGLLFHHGFPASSCFRLGFRCLSPFFSRLSFPRKGFMFHHGFPGSSCFGLGFGFLFPFFSPLSFLNRSVPDSSMHFELHMTLVETCVVAVWGLYWRNYEFCWVRKPLQHFGS